MFRWSSRFDIAVIVLCTLIFYPATMVWCQEAPITVAFDKKTQGFPLAVPGLHTTIVYDVQDAPVVAIAAHALQRDIQQVAGFPLSIDSSGGRSGYTVIIGTLGQSPLINALINTGKLKADSIAGKWETFSISRIKAPVAGSKEALVIAGSDPRGTAFGVFQLSRMIGVSPWVWWADVAPQQRKTIYITGNKSITGPPSVKYRGLFLNDEDWGLQPWAAQHMDTAVRDIGPHTYQKIFELMLRLKANYLWPAMHPCTKAFWYYAGNPELARQYDIVLGASHCEPILRNNVFEWEHLFKEEYGKAPGPWRYDENQEEIDRYWRDRAVESKNNPAVYTVGMRGIHDGSMPGPPSKALKKTLLEKVISDQRALLSQALGKPASQIPQIFCPYKEVLDLYRLHLQLPQDVTIVWADDNYGYIRQLSNPVEQQRTGGSGVYYHLSYWGRPQDYLWLSSISPALISYEMTKAFDAKAQQLWVFNVGDIKPAEMELQFAMDLAWDINAWPPQKAMDYPAYWAGQTFGPAFAPSIGAIKKEYYRLAAAARPEHMNVVDFSEAAAVQRLQDYELLVKKVKALEPTIPAALRDAWFELIAYPVQAAAAMNRKWLYARENHRLAAIGDREGALLAAKQSAAAYDSIRVLTNYYNQDLAGGKWNGIMDDAPRDQAVFKKPVLDTTLAQASTTDTAFIKKDIDVQTAATLIQQAADGSGLRYIPGLGVDGGGITVWPVQVFEKEKAPHITCRLKLAKGENTIAVHCLPDFPLYDGLALRYGIAVGNEPVQWVSVEAQAESKPWSANVLRGYAEGTTLYHTDKDTTVSVTLYFPDPGLVINSIRSMRSE